MITEHRLNLVAERYKALGYNVVVRPGPDELPPFAKDFKVEILATRDDGSVLASAKKSASDMESDPNVPRYAEITSKQPGWRFDIFILGGDSPLEKDGRKAREPSEDDIRRALDEVEQLRRAGFLAASFATAWAVLEAAMRRRLRANGEEAEWETMPRTMMNELYSDGVFSNSTFRRLEGLFRLRSEIVHGFAAPPVEPSAVQFLVETARRLLDESRLATQPA